MKKYKGNIAIYPTKIYLAIKIQLLGKIKLPTYRWGDPEIVKIQIISLFYNKSY